MIRFFLCVVAIAFVAVREDFVRADDPQAAGGAPPQLSGEDWPAFLGPQGTGVSRETGLLERWPETGPPELWSKQIGTGYSAPSVRGDKLVFHHRQRKSEIVECIRAATGDPIWKTDYPTNYSDPYGYNDGPRCTPLLTENRCYTFGAEGKLLCVDLETGKQIWTRDTRKEFNVPPHFFGVGCTPILEGNLLIVLVGGQPNSGVVAFQADTGETVWQNVGKDVWEGADINAQVQSKYRWTGEEMVVSYASPIAATIHGQRHVLCLMRQGLVSVDPKDGRVNFKYWFCSNIDESVNAARPVVIGDKVFLSAAYRVGSALLQVAPSGRDYRVLWRDSENMLCHWSTPVHVGGFLYGFSGRHEGEGELRCLDLATGKVAWKTSGFDGDANDFVQNQTSGELKRRSTGKAAPYPFYGRGSTTVAGGRFIILGERGTLALADATPKGFNEICRASIKNIGYPAWPSPVLSRKKLYLRDENTLLCLDLAPKP